MEGDFIFVCSTRYKIHHALYTYPFSIKDNFCTTKRHVKTLYNEWAGVSNSILYKGVLDSYDNLDNLVLQSVTLYYKVTFS